MRDQVARLAIYTDSQCSSIVLVLSSSLVNTVDDGILFHDEYGFFLVVLLQLFVEFLVELLDFEFFGCVAFLLLREVVTSKL